MPVPEYRVVSIGTLSAHPLWDESRPVRTGHATCTLVASGDARIVINPGLPPSAMLARFEERTRITPKDVTHIFLTAFTADHYRGAGSFPNAQVLIHEPEREAAGTAIREQLARVRDTGDAESEAMVRGHLDLLEKSRDAPDRIEGGVDLFPMPGVTPGTCGILLPLPVRTVLVCGDAVATREHVEQAKVLPGCADVEMAMESFREAIEIADDLIPGRDEALTNPARRGF